jgi:hypothetical protein
MPITAFLVPLPGLIVRDPISKDILAETGEEKPLIGPEGRYWRRRLRDGSVSIYNQKTVKTRRKGEK